MLAWFGLLMLCCALLTATVAAIDERVVRGANLWFKPIKFMVATALFALTTAWLMGLIDRTKRQSPVMVAMAWTLIITALFEVAYITWAAAFGAESHHNTGTLFAAVMFSLMAVAAVALTATQAVLAWAIWRGLPPAPVPVAAQAVILGLVLAWLLGTVSGFLLGGRQPPAYGEGALLFMGWRFDGGDGRPAHFLGLHAHQILPGIGFVLQRTVSHALGRSLLWCCSAGYVMAWWWFMRLALR
jgi:hypothetical protein